MAHLAHRRKATKLRLEHHVIKIHYISNQSNTSFTAAALVPPGALRRYRNSKGSFALSWKILVDKLIKICEFDESRHILVCSRGGDFAARVVKDEKGLNRVFREQVAWFKESEGYGNVVFWALRQSDLEVGRVRELSRDAYLPEAGEDIVADDGRTSKKLIQVVGNWSEGVVAAEGAVVEV